MTYAAPDLDDLRATLNVAARPRHANLPDPHDGNTSPDAPAIRLVDYMGDLDDYYTALIVGPYPDVAARDRDLARLLALPLGAPEFDGGYEFLSSTMAACRRGLGDRTVEPARVADATSVAGFYAAFHGWDDAGEDGSPPNVPGQLGINRADVPA